MLEPGKSSRVLELVVPTLPSSTIGFKSPRTMRLLLFTACKCYLEKRLTFANKNYGKEIKLMSNFMKANERSSSLDFETQREVDTILASNISVTQFLEALIAEPQMRHLWVRVKVCGTVGGELSGCRLDFS
uniref:DUF4143 domain-containing protein n=1 Tax=Mesocestoides corti TaxID=53468 RepID=A0A5K3F570_MESCO